MKVDTRLMKTFQDVGMGCMHFAYGKDMTLEGPEDRLLLVEFCPPK